MSGRLLAGLLYKQIDVLACAGTRAGLRSQRVAERRDGEPQLLNLKRNRVRLVAGGVSQIAVIVDEALSLGLANIRRVQNIPEQEIEIARRNLVGGQTK